MSVQEAVRAVVESRGLQIRATGFDEIDRQHGFLALHLDRLVSWIQKGYGVAASFDALNALSEYTQTHFKFEEQVLRERHYPKLQEHMAKHQAISLKLLTLRVSLESGDDIAEELAELATAWILNHINVDDMEYARFLAARK